MINNDFLHLQKLSLEQKISLCSGMDFWHTAQLVQADGNILLPSIIMSDGPHGLRKQDKAQDNIGIGASVPATCFPTANTLANCWDCDLIFQVGRALGIEAIAQEIDIILGPGVNIKRNPLGGRNFEYFSEDPYLAGLLASAFISGIQSTGIIACIKHFALNNQETQRMSSNSIVDIRAMFETYLKPFELAIKNSTPGSIMTSYNKVNGEYSNQNYELLHNIVRNQWDYDGVILSDWGGCDDIVQAIKAGSNLQMPGSSGVYSCQILQGLQSGEITELDIDNAIYQTIHLVQKIQSNQTNRTKSRLEYTKQDTSTNIEQDSNEHLYSKNHQLAQRVAAESFVLLKNDNHILPLSQDSKISIVGDFALVPRFQGGGSSLVKPTQVDNFIDIAKNYTTTNAQTKLTEQTISNPDTTNTPQSQNQSNHLQIIGAAAGYHRYGKKSKSLSNQAYYTCKDCDYILYFLGLDEFSEVEGIDRKSYYLPQNQIDTLHYLKTLNKPIIAILSCGSAVDTSWDNLVDALLFVGLQGQAGAASILDILLGIQNPSGKLSETFAYQYTDYPNANSYPSPYDTVHYQESIFVGYKHFTTANVLPKYEFGFGLSYSQFEYSAFKITKHKQDIHSKDTNTNDNHFTISVDITNTSNIDAKQVLQVYVTQPDDIFHPKLELRQWTKVFVKANKTVTATIHLNQTDFEYYNIHTKKYELITNGQYTISVGISSQNILYSQPVSLSTKSPSPPIPYTKTDIPHYFAGNVAEIDTTEFSKLLGYTPPAIDSVFVRKNRILVHRNTPISMLRYSRGWVGRLISKIFRLAIQWSKLVGKRERANLMTMVWDSLPLRNLAVFTQGKVDENQVVALIDMCNGHFFRGFHAYRKAKKANKKRQKSLN